MMKFNLHDPLKVRLTELIRLSFREVFNKELDTNLIYSVFSTPPSYEVAHYSFPVFRWAKDLKSSPAKIAQELAEKMSPDHCLIKAQGPYINFKFEAIFLHSQVLPDINSSKYFEKELVLDSKKTLVEYSQPNTHKELHVGHMRNLALGASLILVNKYAGVDIQSATYPGDMGTHVAKCLWFLKYHNTEAVPGQNKGAWLGQMYSKASLKLEAELGSDQEEINRNQLKEILAELLSETGEMYDLWKETKSWSIDLMKEVYSWANVEFDHWYYESEVDQSSLNLVNQYKAKGLFIEDDGAIGIDLSEFKLGFCLLIKRDGHGLYATKDLELARRKFDQLGIEKSIYIVDSRQALHFKQVFKTLELMGFENAKNCEHLAYEFVELPDGAISSRKGNFVTLKDLVSKMEASIKENYLAKHEWNIEEKNEIAKIVAIGAINYGMLSQDSNKKIVFKMDEWLRLDGESGPYIQYTYARIQSVLNKAQGANLGRIDFSKLNQEKELEISIALNQFNNVIEDLIEKNKISALCSYLYSFAKSFNSYYANSPIANNEDADLNASRVELTKAVGLTLKKGLELLNIPAPEKM